MGSLHPQLLLFFDTFMVIILSFFVSFQLLSFLSLYTVYIIDLKYSLKRFYFFQRKTGVCFPADLTVIIFCRCSQSSADGVVFYKGNDKVVLADFVEPKYISK